MAMTTTVSSRTVLGDQVAVSGTFTNGETDSGGDITTGLNWISDYQVGVTSHVNSSEPKTTVSGGTITIVTDNGVDGTWSARGK